MSLTEEHWDKALEYHPYGKRMARDFASQFGYLSLDVEDLGQAALIGLAQAAKDFQPERAASFVTFATRRVWQSLIQEGKRQAPHYAWDRERESIYLQPVDSEEEGALEQMAPRQVPSAEDVALPKLEAEILWRAVDSLPTREARMVRLVYRENRTLTEVALSEGLSKQRVQQIVSRGVHRLLVTLKEVAPVE